MPTSYGNTLKVIRLQRTLRYFALFERKGIVSAKARVFKEHKKGQFGRSRVNEGVGY